MICKKSEFQDSFPFHRLHLKDEQQSKLQDSFAYIGCTTMICNKGKFQDVFPVYRMYKKGEFQDYFAVHTVCYSDRQQT